MRHPKTTLVFVLATTAWATSVQAHEIRCEEHVNRATAFEIGRYPANLTFEVEVFNTHPTEASVVLTADEPFLMHFGETPFTPLPASIPVGQSIHSVFTGLNIPDQTTCLEWAMADGQPDDIIETTLTATTDTGSAQCSAKIFCRTSQGSDVPNPPGVTRTAGFFEVYEGPLQACLGQPPTVCRGESALSVQALPRDLQCVNIEVGEYQRSFTYQVTNTGNLPLHDVQLQNTGPACLFGDQIRFKFDPRFGEEPPPNLPCTFDLAPGESLTVTGVVLGGPPSGDEVICRGASASAVDACGRRLTGEAIALNHAYGYTAGDASQCDQATSSPTCLETPVPTPPLPTTGAGTGLGSAGPIDLGFMKVASLDQALGLFWSSPTLDLRGHPRARLDQARVLLGRQVLAGVCNERLFGTPAPMGLLDSAVGALRGNDATHMLSLVPKVEAYNDSGVNRSLPAGFAAGVATPTHAKQIARDPTPLSTIPFHPVTR